MKCLAWEVHPTPEERVMQALIVLCILLILAPRTWAEDDLGAEPVVASIPKENILPRKSKRPLGVLLKGIDLQVTWAGGPQRPVVAITFDDGPHPVFTPQVLEILEEHGVPATFFVVGRNAKRHPDLIRAMHSRGHCIGNHTYSHVRLTGVGNGSLKDEIDKTREIIFQEIGIHTKLFRPPFGALDSKSLSELASRRLEVILWSVDSRDWSTHRISEIRANVERGSHWGAIILMHDVHPQTVEALPRIIEFLKEKGYGFATVPQLLSPVETAWGG